ncbi:MAG: phosphate acyltransferase [Planctomycetota bacterium]
MSSATSRHGARVLHLRAPEHPAAPAAAFARAGLEVLDVVVPEELGDEALVELARALAPGCAALLVDLVPRRLALLEALAKPVLDVGQGAAVLNLARVLCALAARGVELSAARVALGGAAAARVGDALVALGLDPAQRHVLAAPDAPLPAEVDVVVLPAPNLSEAPDAAGDAKQPAEPGAPARVGLVARDLEEVLPALARAAADTGRRARDESAVARALVGLAREGQLPRPGARGALPVLAAAAAAAGWEGEGPDPLEAGEYREAVGRAVCPGRRALGEAVRRARKSSRRLVFLDAEEAEVLLAARGLLEEGLAEPVLLGDLFRIETRARELAVTLRGMKLINPRRDRLRAPYAEALHRCLGDALGLDLEEARRWVEDPAVFGALGVIRGEAHGIVALMRRDQGLSPLERLLQVLPLRSEARGRPALHLLAWGTPEAPRALVVADAAGPRDATSEEMAEAALHAATFVEAVLGETPRVAFVAEVSYGAARHPALERLQRARDLARLRREGLLADGPLAVDVALDDALQAARYPSCALEGPANVLVFPGCTAARAAVDLLVQAAGARALGPVMWGLRHPVGIAEHGADAEDVAHLALVTAALAIHADRAARDEEPTPLRAALEEAVAAAEPHEAPAEAGAAAASAVATKPGIVFAAAGEARAGAPSSSAISFGAGAGAPTRPPTGAHKVAAVGDEPASARPSPAAQRAGAAPSPGSDPAPARGEAARGQAGRSEAGRSEPGRSEPGRSESGRGEPGRGEPGRSEPGRGEPGRSEPGRGEPGRSEPGRSEPGRSEPGAAGSAGPGSSAAARAPEAAPPRRAASDAAPAPRATPPPRAPRPQPPTEGKRS